MDLVMVDVTDCNCSEGDAAIFFDADHTLNEWAVGEQSLMNSSPA